MNKEFTMSDIIGSAKNLANSVSAKPDNSPWYTSEKPKDLANGNSSMFANIQGGMYRGEPIKGGNIGAFRSNLQWRGDTAGTFGDFVGNFSDLRGRVILNAQRIKYGNLRWDSPEAQAILKATSNQMDKISVDKAVNDTFYGIIDSLTEGDLTGMFQAILGGSGTASAAMAEVEAIKKLLFGGDLQYNTKSDEQIDYDVSGDDAIKAAKESFGWFDPERLTNALKKIGDNVSGTGFKLINSAFNALKGGYLEKKFASAIDWFKDNFALGLPFGAVITAANRLGGKIVGYCLKMTDIYNSNNSGATDVSALRSRVMNLPPAMTDIIDPNGRVYNNNVIACQHILSIIPGTLDYNGFKFFTDFGITNAAIASELSAFENDREGSIIFNASSALASILDISDKTGKRLGVFKPEVMKFSRVYMTAMGRILSRLSPSPAVTISLDESVLKTSGWGAFEIGIGTNTTLTESGSNSFGNSLFDDIMQGTSQKVTEIRNSLMSVTGANISMYKSGENMLDAVTNGNKLNTPKFWESSDFSRSYTLNFRLESPYGDTESLINYVYKPFIALLSCSLPIQVSTYGYTTPFVIRADCPGWFSIDCGYVSSLDFRRAPDEGAFNASGLATAIEVTMSITDIYPALAMSVGVSGLSKNFGEQAFLDSLSGMDYKEIYSGGSLTANLRSRIIALRSLPGIVGNSALAKLSHTAWSASTITGVAVR
jgi:hypothetical protein